MYNIVARLCLFLNRQWEELPSKKKKMQSCLVYAFKVAQVTDLFEAYMQSP